MAYTRPGGNHPPLIYPGNSDPRSTPALQLVKEGYTVVGAAKTSIFLPHQNFSSRVPRFPSFAKFSIVRAGDFTLSRRPNVPVPRFLRFPRLARFRPSWPFWPSLLFRLVISPYPGDRTCPFHVFSVFPGLHVFARSARLAVFAGPSGRFHRYPSNRMCPFHVFSVFPRLTRFRPFWPFWPFSLFRGDFTISRRPNVPVPRFLRFPRLAPFRPFCPSAVFAVPSGDFTVSKRPNVPVPRFLRFLPTYTFSPVLALPFSLFRMVISPYPGDRTCPFHVFSVFPDLYVFARSARFGRFRCFGW